MMFYSYKTSSSLWKTALSLTSGDSLSRDLSHEIIVGAVLQVGAPIRSQRLSFLLAFMVLLGQTPGAVPWEAILPAAQVRGAKGAHGIRSASHSGALGNLVVLTSPGTPDTINVGIWSLFYSAFNNRYYTYRPCCLKDCVFQSLLVTILLWLNQTWHSDR